MKRLIAILAILALTLGLVACGGDKKTATTDAAGTDAAAVTTVA